MYTITSEGDDGNKTYSLLPGIDLNDSRGVESPQISGLASVAYKYNPNGSVELSYSYSHDADIEGRYQFGNYNLYNRENEFQTSSLNFTERELQVYKTALNQVFPKLNNLKVELNGSYIKSSQDVPDLRLFAAYYNAEDDQYITNDSELRKPFHFWRYLDDEQWQAKADITLPILQGKSSSNKIKFGYFYSKKDRNYVENQFTLQNDNVNYSYFNSLTDLNGDVDSYFAPNNVGIVGIDEGSNTNYYQFGHLVKFESYPGSRNNNNYTGYEEITAGYLMLTYQLTKNLKFIGGARLEKTDMEAISDNYFYEIENGQEPDSSKIGKIEETDFLPSLNLVYALNDNMNLRGSYTKTLARPNMREMAPFISFSFIGGPTELGNTALKRTEIQNFDFRWEWFIKPGELAAISAYYKDFKNPIIIQNIYGTDNYEIMYDNVEEGTVYGAFL